LKIAPLLLEIKGITEWWPATRSGTFAGESASKDQQFIYTSNMYLN